MTPTIMVRDTLGVEFGIVLETGEKKVVIFREGGGLIAIEPSEVKGLVDALSELAARAAAESTKGGDSPRV